MPRVEPYEWELSDGRETGPLCKVKQTRTPEIWGWGGELQRPIVCTCQDEKVVPDWEQGGKGALFLVTLIWSRTSVIWS